MDFSDNKRLQLLIWGIIGGVALIAIVLIATANSSGSGFSFLGTGAASDGQSPQTLTVDRQIDLKDDEGEVIPVDSVEDFAAEHGDPPNTDFARLRIPGCVPTGPFLDEVSGG